MWQNENTSTIICEDISTIIQAELPWNEFANKSILITGGNGFLPSYLVFTLIALNDVKNLNIEIKVLVRNKEKAILRFGELLNRNDVELIIQNVEEELPKTIKPNIIIHAASQASPKFYGVDPVGTLTANTIGTFNLLNFCIKNNVKKFLYFSSGEVYGQTNIVPTKEDEYGYIDISNPRSCYGESKRMAEVMCISFAQQFSLNISIVRPFHTYGPGMDLNDGRVYADFVRNLVKGQNIVINSDGLATRAFCYLSDATIGFFTVLLKGNSGQAYNIGNPYQEISINNLAEKIITLSNNKNAQIVFKAKQQNTHYLQSAIQRNSPCIDKAKKLGWQPTTTILEGFQRTIQFYQSK